MSETLDGEPIIVITCKECALQDETCFGPTLNRQMEEFTLCFNCLYWHTRIAEKDDPFSVRIGGKHYTIHADDAPKGARGFGGVLHTIRFFDDSVVETRNLWSQGEIPARFRDRLLDNASFI